MKPASFDDLPAALQEHFLWQMDLDYDSYESSNADCIHGILNGSVSSTNERAIANYYSALSVESILEAAKNVHESLSQQAAAHADLIAALTE